MSIVEVVRKTTTVVEVGHPGVQGPPGTGTAATAVAAHAAAANPHPQYPLASSLATVATSGAYADLSGRPSLGTAAPLNVPATGDAASGEVVKGNDSRMTDARAPTAHTHPSTDINDSTVAGRALLTAADATAQRTALGVPSGSGTSTGANTGDQTITLTGEATGTGTGSFAVTLANSAIIGKVLTGLSTATNAVITAADSILSALGKLQKQISDNLTTLTSHTSNTSNPHATTAAQVGAVSTGAVTTSGLTMSAARLLGRNTASTGAIEEITLGTNLSFSGTILNATGGGLTDAAVLAAARKLAAGNFGAL